MNPNDSVAVGVLNIPRSIYDVVSKFMSDAEMEHLINSAATTQIPREVHEIRSKCPLSVELEYIINRNFEPFYKDILMQLAPEYLLEYESTLKDYDPTIEYGGETRPRGKLQTPEDLEKLERIVNLTKGCKTRINDSCGLHVHAGIDQLDPTNYGINISAADFQLEVMKRVLVNYYRADTSKYEDIPAQNHPLRQNSDAAQSILLKQHMIYDDFVQKVYEAGSYDALLKLACPSPAPDPLVNVVDRNYMVNIHSFAKHGTIEFRQHEGSLEAGEVLKWTNTIDALMKLSIDQAVEYCRNVQANMPPVVDVSVPSLDVQGRSGVKSTAEFSQASATIPHSLADTSVVQAIFQGRGRT